MAACCRAANANCKTPLSFLKGTDGRVGFIKLEKDKQYRSMLEDGWVQTCLMNFLSNLLPKRMATPALLLPPLVAPTKHQYWTKAISINNQLRGPRGPLPASGSPARDGAGGAG